MSARDAARAIAIGRMAAGVGLLLAPSLSARPWLGSGSDRAPVQALLRSLGIRDLILGGLTLHLVDRPGVGPRTVATCAAVDAVDSAAFFAAREQLPSAGGSAVIAATAGLAVAGASLAGALRD